MVKDAWFLLSGPKICNLIARMVFKGIAVFTFVFMHLKDNLWASEKGSESLDGLLLSNASIYFFVVS